MHPKPIHNDCVNHATDAAVPSPLRRARVALPLIVIAGVLTLSACATPGSATPDPTDIVTTSTPTSSPTASPTATSNASPSPSPTVVDATEAPYNGEILIITSEVRDGSLEVSAMVPKVSESGGTCTLTLEATGARVSSEANEGKDVTYCGLMTIALDGAAPTFTVEYSSPTTTAKSSVTTVEPAP